MKLIFIIFLVLSLSSCWQQPLGKNCGLRCQIGVMVTESFAFRENKNCRQHALLVLRLTLVTYANTHLPKIFYSIISEFQCVTTVKQILSFQFCLHTVYLPALVFKRESLCSWQHLDLQIL